MLLRYIGVATLALLRSAYGADSCCFVVQDEAHEVYWVEYVTDVYTVIDNSTSTIVATTSSLVNENPVALYPNPAFTIPQKTEILDTPVETKTGGLTIASPTGFWAYSTAKVFVAPPVTDSNGNVACGTLSSFSKAPTDPAACVPTFTGINANAAAYFHGNNKAQVVEISLTTPFIHVPTRAALRIGPSEACAQGNGAENYGYPVQQLIDHLAGNEFYSAQYPGIENCLPAGPSIQRLNALAVTTETPTGGGLLDPTTLVVVVSTETPDPGTDLTGSPTTTTTSGPTESTTSGNTLTSTSGPAPTSNTFTTSASAPTALPQQPDLSTTAGTPTVETPFDNGGLLPSTTTSSQILSSVTPESAVTEPNSSTTSTDQTATPTSAASESATTETSTVSVIPLPASDGVTTTASGDTTTSDLPLSTESSDASTTSPDVSAESTENPAPTEPTSSTVIPVVINATTTLASTGGTQTPNPVFEASAIKKYVFWKLMIGSIGLAAFGLL